MGETLIYFVYSGIISLKSTLLEFMLFICSCPFVKAMCCTLFSVYAQKENVTLFGVLLDKSRKTLKNLNEKYKSFKL
jgi:hypothetical protein